MDDLDDIVSEFLVESHENLDHLDRDLVALEQDPQSRDLLASIFRTIHTIKGTSGFLAFSRLEELTHVGENLLAKLRDGQLILTVECADALLQMVDRVRELLADIESTGSDANIDVSDVVAAVRAVLDGKPAEPAAVLDETVLDETVLDEAAPTDAVPTEPATPEPVPAETPASVEPAPAAAEAQPAHAPARSVADSSVRVDVDLLDSLMRLVGELVLTRNQVVRQATLNGDADLMQATQRLNIIASELQEGVMKTRMQPMEHIWSKFPRVVRDLGVQCGKSVTLEMVGRETELDRTLLEAVKDPLTHLVRNAVDHGLETPAARVAAGKTAQGTVTLRAFHEGGQVVVEVADDGAGMDPVRIGTSAVTKGVVTADQLAAMSPNDVLQLIFRPGFSTAAQVTNVSGRGVGMDVVKTNIENIGGTIEVDSEKSRGTVCRLRIPLTLAIVPALTVDSAGETYAIPQVNLLELVALSTGSATGTTDVKLERVGDAEVYRLRGQLLPLVRLGVQLDRPSTEPGGGVLAVLQSEGRRFGLVVDRVVNTEDIVVKPLSRLLKSIGTFSGATILGDGRVSLILDVQHLARTALRGDAAADRLATSKGADRPSTEEDRMLVVRIGGDRRVGIPLASVTRLEDIRIDSIERVGNRQVLRRGGHILPLVHLSAVLGSYADQVFDGEEEAQTVPVVVYSTEGRSVAMAVAEILDIVDASDAPHSDIDDLGLLGSLVIKDRVTELLDVRAAILAADPRFYADHDLMTTEGALL